MISATQPFLTWGNQKASTHQIEHSSIPASGAQIIMMMSKHESIITAVPIFLRSVLLQLKIKLYFLIKRPTIVNCHMPTMTWTWTLSNHDIPNRHSIFSFKLFSNNNVRMNKTQAKCKHFQIQGRTVTLSVLTPLLTCFHCPRRQIRCSRTGPRWRGTGRRARRTCPSRNPWCCRGSLRPTVRRSPRRPRPLQMEAAADVRRSRPLLRPPGCGSLQRRCR